MVALVITSPALGNLSSEAKKALQSGVITLRIAQALTVGSENQQHMILEAIDSGERPRPDDIRDMLLRGKASVAMAILPKEKFLDTFTTDLFSDDETTYFDDVDQFLTLQREAVEALAEQRRKTAAWVEVLSLYSVPWWQYREAKKKERSSSGGQKPYGRARLGHRWNRHRPHHHDCWPVPMGTADPANCDGHRPNAYGRVVGALLGVCRIGVF